MGFRFRKSVSIGPVRVNASKTGLGWSVGAPGARYTKMANGRDRVTASIPGTGISWVKESKKEPEEPEKSGIEVFFDILLAILGVIGVIFMVILEFGTKKGFK